MESWPARLCALVVIAFLGACSNQGTSPGADAATRGAAAEAGPTVRAQAVAATPQIVNPAEELAEFAPDGMLRWTDAGAFDYQVWVYADDKLTQFVEFSSPLFPRQYQFRNLTADRTYYVKLYWRTDVNAEFQSLPPFTLKTTASVRKARLLNAQEELEALGSAATLRWSTVPGADIYSLWIYRDSTLVAFAETSGPIPYTQFQITSLKPGVTYHAQVYARVGGQFYAGGALPVTIKATQEQPRILNSQQELDAFAPGDLIRWSAVTGASGYQVWIFSDPNSAKPVEASETASTRLYAPTKLEPGKPYYVQVYAFVGDKRTVGSPYKITTIAKAQYARLTNAQEELEAFSTTGTLKWSAVPGATRYQLWVFGNAGQGSVIEFGAKDDRTYQLQKACSGAIYYVQVYAEVDGKFVTGWPVRLDVTQGASATDCKAPFPEVVFASSADSVPNGGGVKLTWSTKYSDSCTASDAWSGSKPATGQQYIVSITRQALFTLVCTGPGGSRLAQTLVTVTRDATPGGIWIGKESETGLPVRGLITETGEFHFLRDDDSQFFGRLTASGFAIAGPFVGVPPVGYVFLDNSRILSGSLSGAIQPRETMTALAVYQTSSGSRGIANVSLKFDLLYYRPSSLGSIAGNYRDPDTNAVINVNASGIVFSQDSFSGCIINGQISIIDEMYNAYRVEYSFASCRGAYVYLNGTKAHGIGTLDNTVAPEQAIIGVVNEVAGYSLVGSFPRV